MKNKSKHVYLSSGSHAFPNTEIAENPCQQETQDQLPSQATNLLNPLRYTQYSSPEKQGIDCQNRVSKQCEVKNTVNHKYITQEGVILNDE